MLSPHYSHDLLSRTTLYLSGRGTEAQGKARSCSGPLKEFMEQPALTPHAQDTQPRSVCDLARPLTYSFVIRGHKQRMLRWYQNRPARVSYCQPPGKPSGHRLPGLWPHWLLGIPGPWHAAKVKTELQTPEPHSAPSSWFASHCWVCNMPNLCMSRLRGAS